MSDQQKKPSTVEEIIRRIEHSVSFSVMGTVESAVEDVLEREMRRYREDLIAAVKREARQVESSTADEVARTLRSLVSAPLQQPVRDALDAVLRALDGQPIDLMLLSQRVPKAA